MKMWIGGAWQDQLETAIRMTGSEKEDFLDGKICSFEQLKTAKGIYDFHEWIRRELKAEHDPQEQVTQLMEDNPDLLIVSNELGYGIVPYDPFDRAFREATGRICSRIAKQADLVVRVVCGIAQILKNEQNITIRLIRHGETPGNQKKRYIGGATDESLAEEGIRKLKDLHWPSAQRWYVSPMKRCCETAEILSGYKISEKTVFTVWEAFRECDFGLFENKNYQELENEPKYQEWVDSNATLPFPGGESVEGFKKRCTDGFEQMMDEIISQGLDQVNMVVHGGTIMSIMEQFSPQERSYYEWHVENGCGYEMVLNAGQWKTTKKAAMIREVKL